MAKPLLHKHRGTATLTVVVPGAGELVLAGGKIRRQTRSAEQAGTVKLQAKPTSKAARKLRRDGKAKVRPRLTFTPAGGHPGSRKLRFTLKLKGR